jgi:hypothetical protein
MYPHPFTAIFWISQEQTGKGSPIGRKGWSMREETPEICKYSVRKIFFFALPEAPDGHHWDFRAT